MIYTHIYTFGSHNHTKKEAINEITKIIKEKSYSKTFDVLNLRQIPITLVYREELIEPTIVSIYELATGAITIIKEEGILSSYLVTTENEKHYNYSLKLNTETHHVY